jgi:hypothetical protein
MGAKSTQDDFRKLDRAEFERIANKLLGASISELKKIARSRTLPVIETGIAKGLLDDVYRGETKMFDLISSYMPGQTTKPSPFLK